MNFERKAKALPTSQTQTSQAQNIMVNDMSKNGLGSVFVVGVWATFVGVSWWLKGWRTHVWQERDEPEPSTGCHDYVWIEETHAGPTEKAMFRIKFEGDEAKLKLLCLLPTWSGGICSPDDTDIEAAKIIVAKLNTSRQGKQRQDHPYWNFSGTREHVRSMWVQERRRALALRVACLRLVCLLFKGLRVGIVLL